MRSLFFHKWTLLCIMACTGPRLFAEVHIPEGAVDALLETERKMGYSGGNAPQLAPPPGAPQVAPPPAGYQPTPQAYAPRRTLSPAVKSRLRTLGGKQGEKASTRYSQLAELFEQASEPSPLLFKTDSVIIGKCISRFEPDLFTPGYVNIYVEVDDLLGKQIYFVPQLEEHERQIASVENLNQEQYLSLHQQRRGIKRYFTSLQNSYPKDIPLFELLKSKLSKAFFFSFHSPQAEGQAKGGDVYFRLRGGSTRGKNFLIMQRLCPYYPGCQTDGTTVADYQNYVDPFAFCYYTNAVKFRPRNTGY